jgi:hypothetical protein
MKIPMPMCETLNNCALPRVRPGRHRMFLGGTCSHSPFQGERKLGTVVLEVITSIGEH